MISTMNSFAHQGQKPSSLIHPIARYVAAVTDSLSEVIQLFQQMKSRQVQLKDLRHLDERMLRDIGLTGADVRSETVRPIWKC